MEDGGASTPAGRTDGLVPLVTAIRWGVTTVGLLSAVDRPSRSALVAGILLIAHALWRTLRPVEYRPAGWRSLVSILAELAITLVAVCASGTWSSPYVFSLFTPAIAAGFARGFGHALRVAVTAVVTVTIAASLLNTAVERSSVVSWAVELLLVAAVAAYGRHLLTRIDEADVRSRSQLRQLEDANALLVGLDRVARDLPDGLASHDAVAEVFARLRMQARPDLIALLLTDGTDRWRVARAEGASLPESYEAAARPLALLDIADARSPRRQAHGGLLPSSQSVLIAPLRAGDRFVGTLVLESEDPGRFTNEHLDEVSELVGPLGLALDNARWFARLQARGAAAERTRLARDLHDRVGQGVAYVAFELDRLAATMPSADLERLRDEARAMVTELSETLHDLRTEVAVPGDLVPTLEAFLDRVRDRSGLTISFDHEEGEDHRPSLGEEREVLRIAMEAVRNAERHAEATSVAVSWHVNANGAVLFVTDDGSGMAEGGAMTAGFGHGVTGMRERADAIGARLKLAAEPGSGTTVRVELSRHMPAVDTVVPEKAQS